MSWDCAALLSLPLNGANMVVSFGFFILTAKNQEECQKNQEKCQQATYFALLFTLISPCPWLEAAASVLET